MTRTPIIKRFSAGLLLLLFAFSNTPKKTLHNFFAHHTDVTFQFSASKTTLLTQSGFNCHCDDLVVELPFIGSVPLPMPVNTALCRPVAYPDMRTVFFPAPPRYFELRGPPERTAGRRPGSLPQGSVPQVSHFVNYSIACLLS